VRQRTWYALTAGLVTVAAGLLVAPAAASAATAPRYANCAAMQRVYPHGVGKVGARDHVRGTTKPVTTFKVSTSIYNANTRLDGDKDGVACERR
jgi:hypothetical protein